MATLAPSRADLDRLQEAIVTGANAQFDSPEYKRLFALTFTRARARAYLVQRTHWTVNRRDCWALVQGSAPMDVKKIIWDHEREELEGKPEEGIDDHYTLSVSEGAAVGLSPEDFVTIPPCDGLVACMLAWRQLASHSHWMTALAASAALELSNSEEILDGGSNSRRIGEKLERDLGIPMKSQASNVEHAAADVAHGQILMRVAERHMRTPAHLELMLEGLTTSWAIERAWKGLLARHMEDQVED